MPCGRAFDAGGRSAPSGLGPDRQSAPVRREVLVVARPLPLAAPLPADPAERMHDAVAAVDHSLRVARAVGEAAAGGRGYEAAARYIGVSIGLTSIARPKACWDHVPGRPAMKRQLKAEVLSARIERRSSAP
jgi:hypothetical protein